MKKTIGDIPHTLNLIHHPISKQREEGEGRMEEVESKLHLFGCQHFVWLSTKGLILFVTKMCTKFKGTYPP